jgi:hypothetical protein
LVEEIERSVWVVALGDFIPDSQRWLHERAVSRSVDRAVAWAEQPPPPRASVSELARRLER